MSERYCSKRIMNGYHSGTCAAKATVENGGKWYCKRHDPVRVAEKEAEKRAKWDAESKDRQARWDAEKKAKAHADMCVAFHERLVHIVECVWAGVRDSKRELMANGKPASFTGIVDVPVLEDVLIKTRELLVEIEKANQ